MHGNGAPSTLAAMKASWIESSAVIFADALTNGRLVQLQGNGASSKDLAVVKALWNVFSAFSMQPPSDSPELAPEDANMTDVATSVSTAGAGAQLQLLSACCSQHLTQRIC